MENLENNNNDNIISTNQILEYNLPQNQDNSESKITVESNLNLQEITDNSSNDSSIEVPETPNDFISDLAKANNVESIKNDDSGSLESLNSTEKIEDQTASTTNCLALTIREEHKLVAVKNVFLHSLKVTWKVIASTIALHILKIFL